MLKFLLYTTLTNTSKVFLGGVTIFFTPNFIFNLGAPSMLILGIVNYNQLDF